MFQKLLILAVIPFALVSFVAPVQWNTSSGSPEVLVRGGGAQGKVIGRMVSKQWNIETQTANLLTFERQQLSQANRVVFALAGDYMGILDGWVLTFIPGSKGTRVALTSTYVKTQDHGKTSSPATLQEGQEFMQTLSGL